MAQQKAKTSVDGYAVGLLVGMHPPPAGVAQPIAPPVAVSTTTGPTFIPAHTTTSAVTQVTSLPVTAASGATGAPAIARRGRKPTATASTTAATGTAAAATPAGAARPSDKSQPQHVPPTAPSSRPVVLAKIAPSKKKDESKSNPMLVRSTRPHAVAGPSIVVSAQSSGPKEGGEKRKRKEDTPKGDTEDAPVVVSGEMAGEDGAGAEDVPEEPKKKKRKPRVYNDPNIPDEQKPFRCRTCKKGFMQASSMKYHERTHAGDTEDWPYKCKTCGRGFVHQSFLTVHNRIHTGIKPYVCKTCNKAFSQSGNLRTHERSHTGERPYICETCGKGYVTSSVLNIHKRTHTGVKPHKCEICSRSFVQACHLRDHMFTHTGEKPFECPHPSCHSAFTTSGALKVHSRLHTGERPYTCKLCGQAFKQTGALKAHEKTHGKKKPTSVAPAGPVGPPPTLRPTTTSTAPASLPHVTGQGAPALPNPKPVIPAGLAEKSRMQSVAAADATHKPQNIA